MELVRIGIGMLSCVPCCIAAWATAARDKDNTMSVYTLTPQYLLLGLVGGLAGEGLRCFYESQVSESLSRYGPPFGEFMMGVGKFVSILCILIFSRRPFEWFATELDQSHLENYYILLAVLSLGNVIIYCLVACWYGDDAFLLEKEEEKEEEEMTKIVHELVGEGSCGDDTTESFSSRQEAETHEDPLLPSSESTKNTSNYNYVLLRAVTMFSRLSSRAARTPTRGG